MSTPHWDDITDFIDFDDFAINCTLRMQTGMVRKFLGIFDDPYLNSQLGSYESDTNRPTIHCLERDVLGVARGDRVDVDKKSFDVLSAPHVDGTGFAVLELAPAELSG